MVKKVNVSLSTLRISLEFNFTCLVTEVAYNNDDEDSTSNDGSNVSVGDIYHDDMTLIDNTYNPKCMEKDGNYNDVLIGL